MECVDKELPHRTGWGLTIFFCCFQSPFQFVTAYLGSAPLVPLLDIRLLRQAKRDQQVWDNILTYRIQQAPSCLAGQIKVSGNTIQHNAHRLQLIFLSSGVALDCGESLLPWTVANHCSGLLFSLTKHGFLSKQNQETTASSFFYRLSFMPVRNLSTAKATSRQACFLNIQ